MKEKRRKWHHSYDPEIIMGHTDRASLSTEKREIFASYVEQVLSKYVDCCDVEISRHERLITGVNLALSAIVGHEIDFCPDHDCAPFSDEETALAWLSGEINGGCVSPYEFFDNLFSDYMAKTLWNVRIDAERYIECLEASQENWWNFVSETPQLAGFPEFSARIKPAIQSLIYDLCACWFNHVDNTLGLPPRSAGKDNPLIRYIDSCLNMVLPTEVLPSKQTVNIFLHDHVRPYFREMAPKWEEEGRERERAMEEWRQEFYSPDAIAERAAWEDEALRRHENDRSKEKQNLHREAEALRRKMDGVHERLKQYDDIPDIALVDFSRRPAS